MPRVKRRHLTPTGIKPRALVTKCTLRQMRTQRGLSIDDLSLASGVSNACISYVERGSCPTMATAQKLSKFFGCRIDDLWPSDYESTDVVGQVN
jgi:DNA-binding XRE family transcriptional regulator